MEGETLINCKDNLCKYQDVDICSKPEITISEEGECEDKVTVQ